MNINEAKNLIDNSQTILIATPKTIQGDALGSALALFFTLKKLGKNVNLSLEKIPEKFRFLADVPLNASKNFTISINTEEKEINELKYEKDGKNLTIHLNLNRGLLSEKDVSFTAPEGTVLNIEELKEENSYLAETTAELIRLVDSENNLIDENIATCLLAGVVHASQNFRNPQTKSKTFETSAFLIEKGANHQKIIQSLYKQKSVPQIKILGRILEKLNFDETKDLYCSSLAEKDFNECNAKSRDLNFAIEELKFNFRYLPNLLILWERHSFPRSIKGLFYSSRPDSIKIILQNYEGESKGEIAIFSLKETDLISAREKILKIL